MAIFYSACKCILMSTYILYTYSTGIYSLTL